MPEIQVYNYTESKFMRLDSRDLLKALEGNSSSEWVYDWGSGKERHFDCKDLKKAVEGTNPDDMVMEYGVGYIRINSEELRENLNKLKGK